MPSISSVYSLIEKKLSEAGISRSAYTLGADYSDDSYCLYNDEKWWYLGWNERGKKSELARFVGDIEAAEYLVFLLRKDAPGADFPKFDWTEYASLP
jgi:hypothetical protein